MVSGPVVRKKTAVRTLFLTLTAVALAAIVPLAAVLASGPVVPDYMRGDLRIDSLTYAPANPAPGEPITVTATIGGLSTGRHQVSLQYATYFATTDAGRVDMSATGPRTYTATVPGVPDGTEVWFVAAITPDVGMPVVSESTFIDVGTVVRDGPSHLDVVSVRHEVMNQWAPGETQIEVTATVTSASMVTEVDIAYMAFCSRSSRPVDPELTYRAPTEYTITIGIPAPCNARMNTVLLYVVIAEDSSGNTAVSDLGTVTFNQQEAWR